MRLILMLLLCTGCSGPYPSDIMRRPVVPGYPKPGHTYLIFDAGQGFRVEYFAARQVWLWAAQGERLVRGRWRIWDRHRIKTDKGKPLDIGFELCFAFTQRADDTLGEQDWACMPIRRLADTVVAELKGDVFALRGARLPPYRLPRCRPPSEFTLLREAGC